MWGVFGAFFVWRLCDPVMVLSNVSTPELESLRQDYIDSTNLNEEAHMNTYKIPSYLWDYAPKSHTILRNYSRLHFRAVNEIELSEDDCVNYFNKLHTEKQQNYNTIEQSLYRALNHVYIHLSKTGALKKCTYKGRYDEHDNLIALSEAEKKNLESKRA
jgi:hypothetical protein